MNPAPFDMKDLSKLKFFVTGGSGTFGRHIIRELLNRGALDIVSISRDEGLIKEAKEWVDSDLVKFHVGDITDGGYLQKILRNVDILFHAAALKDVPLAERYPREVLKVNVLGILSLLEYSANISRFINISSDKAISIVNCYGASKLFAEYLVHETNSFNQGLFVSVRCPNLLGSRGSVLDVWLNQLKLRNRLELTDSDMTRYFITPSDAASFVVANSLRPELSVSEIAYPMEYSHKLKLGDLAQAFINVFGNAHTTLDIIGKRPGEKIHEDYVGSVSLSSVAELELYLKNLKL